MKASGIITVLGGVGALVLLGLMVVLGGDETEPVRSPISEPRVGATSEGSARARPAHPSQASGTAPSRPGMTSQPASARTQQPSTSAGGPSGDREPSARGTAGAVDGPGAGDAPGGGAEPGAVGAVGAAGQLSEVNKVLEVARRAPREDDRINAVRWLGENGSPQEFDALQDIQINDPSAQVRMAAEIAVNTLRERRANEPFPGVTPKADPQDYMRDVALPSP